MYFPPSFYWLRGILNTIYTAGYSGLTPAQLGAMAERLGAVIIDVRYSPFSRDAAWRKPAMAKLWGKWYRHLNEFGNRNYKGNEIVIADFEKGVEEITPILKDHPVILLCACWSFQLCHRKVVADRLAARLGTSVTHLTKKDFPSKEEVESDQESLF